ncbi:MAG: stage III sporulation protein AA [Lachnospiraceae bacterium]
MEKEKYGEILSVLPIRLRSVMESQLQEEPRLQEIRLRTGRPAGVCRDGKEVFLTETGILTAADLQETMEFVSRFSMYAYEDELRQGYLTIRGGHRVGIAGKVVLQQGIIRSVRDISGIHIRIACAWKDCALPVLPWIYERGDLKNTLILSPPGKGKTTLLRDLIRLVSDGNHEGEGLSVSVVDERGEIGACERGVPQHDLGMRTDVLDGCPKVHGMRMMLRSMSPQVIAVDEIGSMSDLEAVMEICGCGCRILATAHADSLEHLVRKEGFSRLYQHQLFGRYLLLDEQKVGKIRTVYDEKGERMQS